MLCKTKFIVLFLSIATIAFFGCRKERTSTGGGVAVDTMPHVRKWIVRTIAGDGRPVFADGPSLSASFRLPFDVAIDATGNIYVADGLNHRIRKISDGFVSTFAGTGIQDTTNGIAIHAGYSIPSRLAFDLLGNLLSLDVLDSRVRRISSLAFVSTVAGAVSIGFMDGPAILSRFERCFGIVTDATGNIYIADSGNKRIRKITANGQVITIAGTGAEGFKNGAADSAEFFYPQGLALDQEGNLFVADMNRIRKISPAGIVSTFAGSDSIGFIDGQGAQARFTEIEDIVTDEQGNIYAADENHIRQITPQGVVTTIAGSTQGFVDGEGSVAKFNGALGLGIDRHGNIYVADANNSRIRKISLDNN